jgi:hypothetical protein
MTSSDKPVPRILQQEPQRDSDQKQEQPKPAGKGGQQMGEGSYEATRDYEKDIEEYLKNADVEGDARAARPRSQQEARELEEAEKKGRSHSRGEH